MKWRPLAAEHAGPKPHACAPAFQRTTKCPPTRHNRKQDTPSGTTANTSTTSTNQKREHQNKLSECNERLEVPKCPVAPKGRLSTADMLLVSPVFSVPVVSYAAQCRVRCALLSSDSWWVQEGRIAVLSRLRQVHFFRARVSEPAVAMQMIASVSLSFCSLCCASARKQSLVALRVGGWCGGGGEDFPCMFAKPTFFGMFRNMLCV